MRKTKRRPSRRKARPSTPSLRLRSGRSPTPARNFESAPIFFPIAARDPYRYTKTIDNPAKPRGSTVLQISAVKRAQGTRTAENPLRAARRASDRCFGRALRAKPQSAFVRIARTEKVPRTRKRSGKMYRSPAAGPKTKRKRKEDARSSVLCGSASSRSDPRRTGSVGQSTNYFASCERAFWTENGQAW